MELFRDPSILGWGAAALAALLYFRYRAELRRTETARRLLGPSYELHARSPGAARRRLRGLLYVCALGLLALAAAGPQWGVELTPVTDLKGNVVIAVDTSLSMAARDMKPSRLENARLLLGAIAENFADYRIGVVAFAGEAYVQCPLTTDQEAVSYFASALTPGMLPAQGTDFSSAIETTLGMLSRYGGQKVMVLITDGEDHSTVLDTALKAAEEQNLKIFTIGIGTPDGELIPMTDSAGNLMEHKKDSSGKTVVTRLGEAELMKIAGRTGAAYLRYSGPDSAAADVRRAVGALDLEKSKGKGRGHFKNRYQWPLAAALLLLLIELLVMEKGFRLETRWFRRTPAAAALLLCLAGSASAGSASLARKGNSAYDEKDWAKAFEYYSRAQEKDPADKRLQFNAGDAFYRLEEYAKAREFYEQAAADPKLAARAGYNRGNALFKAGDLQGAITSYKAALRLDPDDENALFNLQKALEQKKKNSCSDPKEDKKDKDKKEQEKKDQQKKDQDKKDQDKKDQQKKEEEKKSEQEKKKAEARQKARQILEMMKEKEKAAAREQNPAQQALRQAGKPPPRPRMEDW